jgi:ABC-type sugar transport system permease subunit
VADVWHHPVRGPALLRAALDIPDELYEAAEVDGAAGVQAFARITWPLVRPILGGALFRTWTRCGRDLMFVLTGGGRPAPPRPSPCTPTARSLPDPAGGLRLRHRVVVFVLVMVVAVAYLG